MNGDETTVTVGEFISIEDRVDTVIPGPNQDIQEDAEGWHLIYTLGAWDCTLSSFKGIEEIYPCPI